MKHNILDIKGLKVGQAQNTEAKTGVTVVIAEKVNVSPTPANTLLLSISSGQSLGCEYDVESAAIIFPAISTLSISGTFLSTKSE